MRIFGSVQSCFWSNPDTQELNDQSKLLAIYLLTGPHTNMLGCFRLPDGYITEDLKWANDAVTSALNNLSAINFLTRDPFFSWLVIHDFLKWNPVQNPRQGTGIQRLFEQVPRKSTVWKPLVKGLITYGKYLDDGFRNSLETIFSNCNADKEQNKEQNKDQDEIFMSGKPDDDYFIANDKNETNKNSKLENEAIAVLDFLNEKAGKAYRPVESNLNLIVARLKTGASVMDCRQVIAKKTREWKGDLKMAEYLRPATLFNALKFEQYMGELVMKVEENVNEK